MARFWSSAEIVLYAPCNKSGLVDIDASGLIKETDKKTECKIHLPRHYKNEMLASRIVPI